MSHLIPAFILLIATTKFMSMQTYQTAFLLPSRRSFGYSSLNTSDLTMQVNLLLSKQTKMQILFNMLFSLCHSQWELTSYLWVRGQVSNSWRLEVLLMNGMVWGNTLRDSKPLWRWNEVWRQRENKIEGLTCERKKPYKRQQQQHQQTGQEGRSEDTEHCLMTDCPTKDGGRQRDGSKNHRQRRSRKQWQRIGLPCGLVAINANRRNGKEREGGWLQLCFMQIVEAVRGWNGKFKISILSDLSLKSPLTPVIYLLWSWEVRSWDEGRMH